MIQLGCTPVVIGILSFELGVDRFSARINSELVDRAVPPENGNQGFFPLAVIDLLLK